MKGILLNSPTCLKFLCEQVNCCAEEKTGVYLGGNYTHRQSLHMVKPSEVNK